MPDSFKAAQRNASAQLQTAIDKGLIERPDICTRCGKRPYDKAIQGHHWTYDRPLEVEWLCCLCHIDAHRFGNHAIA
jgi:hypothetical protein